MELTVLCGKMAVRQQHTANSNNLMTAGKKADVLDFFSSGDNCTKPGDHNGAGGAERGHRQQDKVVISASASGKG